MLAWEQRLGPAGNEALASRRVTHFSFQHLTSPHKSMMSQASNECLPTSKSRTDSIVCDQVNGQQDKLLPVNHRPNAEACDQGSKQSSSGNSSFKFSILQCKVDSRATLSSSAATEQRSIAERPAPSTTSGQGSIAERP